MSNKSSFSKKSNVSASKKKFSIYDYSLPKVTKRIAAYIVDVILFIVTATGIGYLTSVIYGYDKWYTKMLDVMKEHEVYVPVSEGSMEYTYCDSTLDSCKTAQNKCLSDPDYIEAYQKIFWGIIVILTVAIVVSLLIYEFILPIILKHGRTLGMRFFDIGYITDEGVEPPVKSIFVRFLFGKCILEWLIPVLSIYLLYLGAIGAQYGLLGVIFIVVIILLNLYMVIFTKNKRGIHDYIARMQPVDNSCQIYFKTTEELSSARAQEAREKQSRYM